MGKKKKIIILDVETNNNQQVFDIGLVVGDLYNHIYQQEQYIIKEVFNEKLFWEKKRPEYEQVIKDSNHPAKLVTAQQAFAKIENIIKKYDIKEVYAYNASFDATALDNLAREFNCYNPINDLEINCLWLWSAITILQQKTFKKWALKNNCLTEKGHFKTSAETVYSYIINKAEFEEVHRGLEDCLIEYQIFLDCYKQRKKRVKGICYNPWILVQDDKQINKLPKQYRTMRLNLEQQLKDAGIIIQQLNKPISPVVAKE